MPLEVFYLVNYVFKDLCTRSRSCSSRKPETHINDFLNEEIIDLRSITVGDNSLTTAPIYCEACNYKICIIS